MKKKIFAMLFAAVFAASFFAGCAKTDETDSSMPTDTAVLTGTSAKQTEMLTDSSDNGSTVEDTTPVNFSQSVGDYPYYSNEDILKDERFMVFEATLEDVSFFVGDYTGKVFNPPEKVSDYVKNHTKEEYGHICLATVYTLKVVKSWKGNPSEEIKALHGGGLRGLKEEEQIQAIRAVDAQGELHNTISAEPYKTLEIGKTYLFTAFIEEDTTLAISGYEDALRCCNPVQWAYELGSKEANDLIDFMKKNVKAG